MKYVLLDIEQTLLQGCTYYHGKAGIGDFTPIKNEAKKYSLEEVKTILDVLPKEKFVLVPIEYLDSVLTIAEASKLWGKEVSTLRRVIKNGKFIEGLDYRKSGTTWLITKDSLIKYYGEPKSK